METMLDILKGRLIEGVQIMKCKERASDYKIVLSKDGLNYDTTLPKSCTPGMEETLVDKTIYSALSSFALQQNDIAKTKYWLNKCQQRNTSW